MTDGRTFKEEMALEKEKLSRMNFIEKISYILTYYWLPITATIVTIVAIIFFARSYYESSKEELISGVILNTSTSDEGVTCLSDDYYEYLGGTKRQTVSITPDMYIDFSLSDQASYYSNVKIIALISANAVDYMLLDDEALLNYGSQSAFLNLEELLPEDLYTELEDYIVTVDDDETGTTYPAAIDVTNLGFGKTYGFSEDPTYLVFVTNSERTDAMVPFLEYFLAQ